jgi:hypothetical protein
MPKRNIHKKNILLTAGLFLTLIFIISWIKISNHPTSVPVFYADEQDLGLKLDLQYATGKVEPHTYGNRVEWTLPQLTLSWDWNDYRQPAEELGKTDSILVFWDSDLVWQAGVTEPASLGSGGSISSRPGDEIKREHGRIMESPESLTNYAELSLPASASGSIAIHLCPPSIEDMAVPPDYIDVYYVHARKKFFTGWSNSIVKKRVVMDNSVFHESIGLFQDDRSSIQISLPTANVPVEGEWAAFATYPVVKIGDTILELKDYKILYQPGAPYELLRRPFVYTAKGDVLFINEVYPNELYQITGEGEIIKIETPFAEIFALAAHPQTNRIALTGNLPKGEPEKSYIELDLDQKQFIEFFRHVVRDGHSGGDSHPSLTYSADGILYYDMYDGITPSIYAYDGKAVSLLQENAFKPNISPDGKYLAYISLGNNADNYNRTSARLEILDLSTAKVIGSIAGNGTIQWGTPNSEGQFDTVYLAEQTSLKSIKVGPSGLELAENLEVGGHPVFIKSNGRMEIYIEWPGKGSSQTIWKRVIELSHERQPTRYPAVQQTPANIPQQQAANNEVMPSDVIVALNAKDSGEENPEYNRILATVELPRSLGISLPNIDITKVHDTHLLSQRERELLMSHGFSFEEIASMDFGDFKNIEKTWLLTPEMIKSIKVIYPALAHIDLSKWNYGDFLAYSMEADAKTYAPTTEQAEAIKARNITLNDARKLLKDFHSYDSLLKQSDDTLKELLERYYQFTIDYIKQLAESSE